MLFATIDLLSNKNNRKLILQKNKLLSIGLLSLAVIIACVQHKYSYKAYEYQSESEEYDGNEDEESENAEEENEDELIENEKKSDQILNTKNINEKAAEELGEKNSNNTNNNNKLLQENNTIEKSDNNKPPKSTMDIVVRKGETICTILGKQGISQSEALKISSSISKIFKLKNIRTGLKITLNLNNNNDITTLERLEFKPNPKYKVIVNKNKSNFITTKENVKLKKVIHNISGTINPKSIKNSLQKCNIEKKMEKETMSVLKNVTNIQNVKKPIDFDLVYEKYYDEENKNIENKFLCISAVIDGKIKRIYKFNNDGSEEYIHSDGTVINSSKRSMFIQPISYYKKISSKFGPRIHPITGKYKVHTGVDFSANIGTPIKAAASGTVIKATRVSGYGNYISINHGNEIKTAYAHLSKILVRNGQYVKQGQIIAYSGNSGNSTGPHLHYELSNNGKFINPLSFIPKKPRQLTGRKLAQFNNFKHSIHLKVAKLNSQKVKNIV